MRAEFESQSASKRGGSADKTKATPTHLTRVVSIRFKARRVGRPKLSVVTPKYYVSIRFKARRVGRLAPLQPEVKSQQKMPLSIGWV